MICEGCGEVIGDGIRNGRIDEGVSSTTDFICLSPDETSRSLATGGDNLNATRVGRQAWSGQRVLMLPPLHGMYTRDIELLLPGTSPYLDAPSVNRTQTRAPIGITLRVFHQLHK